MASTKAMKTGRAELNSKTRRPEFSSKLFFMLFSILGLGLLFYSNSSGVPQRSQAPGNPTTGFGLWFGFDTGRLPTAVFTLRFLNVLSFRFTPLLCRIVRDASKTSLLSNQCR